MYTVHPWHSGQCMHVTSSTAYLLKYIMHKLNTTSYNQAQTPYMPCQIIIIIFYNIIIMTELGPWNNSVQASAHVCVLVVEWETVIHIFAMK